MGTRKRDRQPAMWVADDGPADGREPSVLSAVESDAARARVRRLRRSAVRQRSTPRRWAGPSLPPGIYFRLLLIGYFEGIDSERGIAWRAADSLALRDFLGVGLDEAPPDHSTISRTRRLIDARNASRRVYVGAAVPETAGSGQGQDDRRSTPRRWKPTRRCGASCDATAARAMRSF